MVDIHTHILFGIDDGPETLEESIEILRKGMSLGFKEFYLTSHYGKGKFYNENYEKNFKILEERCQNLCLDIKLQRGNEVYLDESIFKILEEKKYNLIEGKFLLVEFSPLTMPRIGIYMIKKILNMGIKPILAHVERYTQFKEKDLLELRKMGCRLQVNIGGKKPRHILKLLKKNQIDVLGSDVHRVEKRGYSSDDLEVLKKLVGEREIKRMTSIMRLEKEEKKSEETKSNSWIYSSIIRSILRGTWIGRDS